MTLNPVKLERAVTFMHYYAGVVSLIFLLKTLIWNKITFPASNLLNIAELVEHELMKNIFPKNSSSNPFFIQFIVACCKDFKSLKKLDNFTKFLISIVFY